MDPKISDLKFKILKKKRYFLMKNEILSIDHKMICIWFRDENQTSKRSNFLPKPIMIDRKKFIFHQKVSFFFKISNLKSEIFGSMEIHYLTQCLSKNVIVMTLEISRE